MIETEGFQPLQAQGFGDLRVIAEARMCVKGQVTGIQGQVMVQEKLQPPVVKPADALQRIAPTQAVMANDQLAFAARRFFEECQ